MRESFTIQVSQYIEKYSLMDYFCPKCGNQTIYHGWQSASSVCISCKSFWQIRVNDRPSMTDRLMADRSIDE